MIVAVAVQPHDRDPLRLSLQPVDFAHQLTVRSFFVSVDDDHVEKVAVNFFHLAGFFNYLFQVVVLFLEIPFIIPKKKKKHIKSENFQIENTLTVSPLSRFLARNFSSEGGATKTTKGIRFDSLRILRD